jgi:hypothetical protein
MTVTIYRGAFLRAFCRNLFSRVVKSQENQGAFSARWISDEDF